MEPNDREKGTAKNQSDDRKSRKFEMIVLFKEMSLVDRCGFGALRKCKLLVL